MLGIFDPLAASAATAVARLGRGDAAGFRSILDPTVPLARMIFRSPTRHYKSGIVFLAWLNGFQDHFIMLGGAQSMRPLAYYVGIFKLADKCGTAQEPGACGAPDAETIGGLRKLEQGLGLSISPIEETRLG